MPGNSVSLRLFCQTKCCKHTPGHSLCPSEHSLPLLGGSTGAEEALQANASFRTAESGASDLASHSSGPAAAGSCEGDPLVILPICLAFGAQREHAVWD